MAHAEHAAAGLAAHRKGFGKNLVQGLTGGKPLLELRGLGLQLGVRELLDRRLQRIDLGDEAGELAQLAFVTTAKDTVSRLLIIEETG